MFNYEQISNDARNYHGTITQNNRRIQAIITALIGAFACGEKISSLSFDEKELKKVDLTKNIEIYKEANKDVKSLESALALLQNENKMILIRFNSKNNILKQHYMMSPKAFYNDFFLIKGDILLKIGEKDLLNKLMNKKINTSVVGLGQEVMIFFDNHEDFYNIKQFFTKNDITLEYKKEKFELNENNEQFISYLYKKK